MAASNSAHHAKAGRFEGIKRGWDIISRSVSRPAAAVIPAPIAYIKVVAVKKLVVETWVWLAGPPHRVYLSGRAFLLENLMPFTGCVGEPGLLL